uniref:Secreted protein n=1 Tax=Zea mays TaxID=4577 RepID=A0A804NK95_MAIZE
MPMAAPAAMATSILALLLTPATHTIVPSDLPRRRALRCVALPLLEVVQTRTNTHESTVIHWACGRTAATSSNSLPHSGTSSAAPSAALGVRVRTSIVCYHAADGWHMREGGGRRHPPRGHQIWSPGWR